MLTEYEKTEKRLSGYLASLRRIEKLKVKIAEARQRLIPGSLDYSKPKVMCSNSDRMGNIVAYIDSLESGLDNEIEKSERLKRIIYHKIVKAFPDKDIPCRRVLVLKYLKGKKMTDIANHLGYSEAYTYRLRKQAINTLIEIESKSTENKG